MIESSIPSDPDVDLENQSVTVRGGGPYPDDSFVEAGVAADGPVSLVGDKRFEEKKRKAIDRLKSKNCIKFLGKLSGFSIEQIRDAVNSHPAFSADRSTSVLVRDSGIYTARGIQEIMDAPINQGNDLARERLDISVAEFIGREGANAITNKDPGKPGIYYHEEANYDSQTVLHESLHYLTNLDDIGLSRALGLVDSKKRAYEEKSAASQAIKDAINLECRK